jgi:hypothetical protein
METFFNGNANTIKGLLFMIGGFVLLLNTMGITMQVIHYSIFLGAVAMIVYGFVEAGYYKKIVSLIKK